MGQAVLRAILAGVAFPAGDAGDLPDGVVARVNGELVTSDAFADWLAATHGWSYVEEYLELVVLRQEAARLGIEVTPADLEEALERDWRDVVVMRFKGDEGGFLDSLRQEGLDAAGWRARRRFDLEHVVLARKLVLRERQPSEAALRELFAAWFPGATRRHLQVAFFDRFRDVAPVRTPSEALLERHDRAALERAAAFQAAVAADPATFAARARQEADALLVPRHDGMREDLRATGSELPRYHPGMIPGLPLEELVDLDALAADEVAGPLRVPAGYAVVRNVRREAVAFEAVRAELDELYRTRPPSPQELHALRQRLLQAAQVEKAPAWRIR